MLKDCELSGKATFAKLWMKDCERLSDAQGLSAAMQSHSFLALVEGIPEAQGLQTAREATLLKLWLNEPPKLKDCKMPSKATFSLTETPKVKDCRLPSKAIIDKLWSNKPPKLRGCKLLGKVTFLKLWLNASPM